MAIHVIGFRWGDSDENHKYDYESLANIPSTDLGVLDIDTTAEQGTDDGDLYRAIHSFSWDSVINTLSGILNVKKLFTNIINQVKSNKDKLDNPGQIVKDGIGSYSTSSSVINSDRFIIKENDGSIKQVTPLNVLKGGVRGLSTVVSYANRYIPIISTSDSSDVSRTTIADATKAGIYNLTTGTASGLNSNKSDKIVVQTTPPAGSLDPAYVEKHTLSEIYELFGIVDKTTPLLNFDDTATDPLTDDGALANALTALGILSDVIPSGGGSLYLKKALTEILEYMSTQYVVETKQTTETPSVAGGGRATVYIDVTKTGYTAIGIVGVMIWGTEVFSIGRLALTYSKTQAAIGIINTYTDARTPDAIDVHVLYRKS